MDVSHAEETASKKMDTKPDSAADEQKMDVESVQFRSVILK